MYTAAAETATAATEVLPDGEPYEEQEQGFAARERCAGLD